MVFMLEALTEYVAIGEAQAFSKAVIDWLQGQRQLRGHAPSAAVPGNSEALGWQRGLMQSRVWSGCTEKSPGEQLVNMDLSMSPPGKQRKTSQIMAHCLGNEQIPNTPIAFRDGSFLTFGQSRLS